MSVLETCVATLRVHVPDVVAIYVFGSMADGRTHSTSDVDLALLAGGPLDPAVRFEIAQDLALAANRDVDLVDLRTATTVMRMQVVGSGRCLYSADDSEREAFETFTYSSYARLNEERRGILDDVRARRSIYGR